MTSKKMAWFFLISAIALLDPPVCSAEWKELADKHFVVHYGEKVETEKARQLLRRAEEYYTRIAERIGFTRYTDFWTWEERVKIIVYGDQKEFVESTGQPLWSLGYADRDARVLKSRAILTYLQEQNFFDGVLPHEISHLILRDFFGAGVNIPVWFDEGVAQLQEAQKVAMANEIMPKLIAKNLQWPFPEFMSTDVRHEKNKQRVSVFYAQSVSVIDFMISNYGQEAFGRLCKAMAEGNEFETALTKTYKDSIDSLDALQRKWIDSFK